MILRRASFGALAEARSLRDKIIFEGANGFKERTIFEREKERAWRF